MLVLAGYAAHRGYLDFAAVVGVAWIGAVLGDQFYFWLGRRHGQAVLKRWPKRAESIERALALIDRHPVKLILAMRFAWGLRTALPIAIGLSRVSSIRFFLLNLASAALWAPLVAGTGFAFGAALSRHVQELQRIEHWVLAGLVLLIALMHAYRGWRRRCNR
mgnify:CR=1 FL=1